MVEGRCHSTAAPRWVCHLWRPQDSASNIYVAANVGIPPARLQVLDPRHKVEDHGLAPGVGDDDNLQTAAEAVSRNRSRKLCGS